MNKSIPVVFALLLAACSSIFPNKTTDTREWQKVNCNGAAGWETCFRKAEAHCPNGFDTANREENMVTGLRAFAVSCRK
jgi:hypothetical protein